MRQAITTGQMINYCWTLNWTNTVSLYLRTFLFTKQSVNIFYIRTSWTSEDADKETKCKDIKAEAKAKNETSADFENCVSGEVVQDYGIPYDFESIMQYGLTVNGITRMEPLGGIKPAKIGNSELSDADKKRIKMSYGCDACGGAQIGSKGEIKAVFSSCEWKLETEPEKQIILDIKVETTSTSWQ